MAATAYDAKNVTITIDNTNVTGLAEGTFVTIEKDEDYFTTSVGAQGEVQFAKINNQLYTVTLTLQQTSPSVATLDTLAAKVTPFTVSIINKTGEESTEKFTCTEALVKKPAGRTYSAELEDREFEIQCLDGSFGEKASGDTGAGETA